MSNDLHNNKQCDINNNTDININNFDTKNCITPNEDRDRENNSKNDELSREINKDKINNESINVNIYRYKFIESFTIELHNFSKIHQYDHRKDFKEAWTKWTEDNSDIIDEEVRRLTNLDYNGDVLDKMFKSARYYFRKKVEIPKEDQQKRREYVGISKNLLASMDAHIKSNINNKDYKPSDGFSEYCNQNIDVLREEVNNLCKNGLTDSNEIKSKIKKTYKNRYFLIINKL